VDPTEMVGQLVSLNQLDQLISINSTLSGLVTPTSAATTSASPTATSPLGAAGAAAASPTSLAAAQAALEKLQTPTGRASTSSLMNLYSSMGVPAQNATF